MEIPLFRVLRVIFGKRIISRNFGNFRITIDYKSQTQNTEHILPFFSINGYNGIHFYLCFCFHPRIIDIRQIACKNLCSKLQETSIKFRKFVTPFQESAFSCGSTILRPVSCRPRLNKLARAPRK